MAVKAAGGARSPSEDHLQAVTGGGPGPDPERRAHWPGPAPESVEPDIMTCRTSRFASWLTVTVPWLVGCAAEAPSAVATVRDSAGIRIVEHARAPTGLVAWSVAEQPEALIGSLADSDPAHQFTEVRGVVRLSDGRVVVGDWGTKEARYFDASGRHILTVGGGGSGPGEVRFLFSVDRLQGDTVIVGGWPIGSRYWFDEDGAFVRGQALGPWFPGMLGRTLPDGSLVLDTYAFGSYGNTIESWAANGPDEDIRPEGVIELVSRDGSWVDTIGPIRGEWHHKTGEIGVNYAGHALPYSPIGLVAWSVDRLFVGHTERPEVAAYAMDGRLVQLIRWSPEPVPVRAADRAAFEDDVMAGLRRPDQAPHFRRWLSEISYPDLKPPFAAMIADEDGYLWVGPSAPVEVDEVTWTVYGPDGTATATVSIPARHRVLDVDSTHVVATWTDDLDVASVGVFALTR
jgi:hypothetical protein